MSLKSFIRSLVLPLERWEPVYRGFLRLRGVPSRPSKVTGSFGGGGALKRRDDWQESVQVLQAAGLRPHPEAAKNWDALEALRLILERTGPEVRVLDAGGEVYSPLTEWLYLYGYRHLEVMNLVFDSPFRRGPIRYVPGDITNTDYPEESFDFITCLSVIEHGVPFEAFIREMARLLVPGGVLFVSTDYWSAPLPEAAGKEAYDQPVHILTPDELRELEATAARHGLRSLGDPDYGVREKAVRWERMNLEFTFVAAAFEKVSTGDSSGR